ncbi:MAG: hypothetical protein M1828_001260 [Chrysothrix sp. TS-e1954]|nr:MAG: hypothetical protein M1828_001260 [Chrysothrix sp. TS-e1954]
MTCCTCASILDRTPEKKEVLSEKSSRPNTPPQAYRLLPCCGRAVCERCIERNPRFESYCTFCQISTGPALLPQGLRDPPGYDSTPASPGQQKTNGRRHQNDEAVGGDEPPEYTPRDMSAQARYDEPAPDVTHHLHPSDTVHSLSLAYGVPLQVLRNHNNLFTDHLLQGRRTASIPGSHYQGPSLSPNPVEGEEESERKAKVRRFMMQTKCHQYDMAEVYLNNAKGDVSKAIERWKDDEKWERENPMKTNGKGKVGRRKDASSGLTGQLT